MIRAVAKAQLNIDVYEQKRTLVKISLKRSAIPAVAFSNNTSMSTSATRVSPYTTSSHKLGMSIEYQVSTLASPILKPHILRTQSANLPPQSLPHFFPVPRRDQPFTMKRRRRNSDPCTKRHHHHPTRRISVSWRRLILPLGARRNQLRPATSTEYSVTRTPGTPGSS